MKNSILLLLTIFASVLCRAQEEEPVLSADRPGYTWGTEVLHLHKVSWENGLCFESIPDGADAFTLNSTIVRYGIFNNVELRVGADFLMSPQTRAGYSLTMAPLTVGTKVKVYEGSDWLPSIGFLAEFQSPHLGSKELLPSHIAPSMYLLFEHEIGELFSLCYNAGLIWDGETAAPQTFLALAFGYNITDNLGAFIETYNYLHPSEGNQYMTEFGLFWMPSRRLQLDLECDLDFQDFGRYFAVGCGISWMLN